MINNSHPCGMKEEMLKKLSKFKREKVHLILVLIQLKTGAEEMKSLLKAKTKPFIKDNKIPKLVRKMVKADKCGQMGQFIKGGGQMTKQMEEVA